MARTDILLDPDNINAVAPDGSLNIATSPDVFTSSGEDKEPDIRLTPSESSLQLGGGAGEEWSPSTVSLFNEGAPRIYLTSGSGITSAPETNPEEQVFTVSMESGDEKAGILEMGKVGEGVPRVEVDAGRSLLNLGNPSEPGRLMLFGEATHTIIHEAEEATIEVGGAPKFDGEATGGGVPGSIELRNSKDTETVIVEGGAETEGEVHGGGIRLKNADNYETVVIEGSTETEENVRGGRIRLKDRGGFSNVEVDGGTGTLILGAAPPVAAPSLEHVQKASENGEVWLHDGTGRKFGLTAEGGTIGLGPSSDSSGIGLVLKPEAGIFAIVDGSGNVIFRVDTDAKSVGFPLEFTLDDKMDGNLNIDELLKGQ